MENPKKTKKLKNWICEREIDFTFIIWAERLILRRCSWIICRVTPNDILESIFFTYFSQEIKNNYFEIIQSLIQFIYPEYKIYSRYDMLTIVLSCIYFSFVNIKNIDKNIQEEANKNFSEIMKKINFIDFTKIDECMNDINKLINEDENINQENVEENEVNYEKCITRSNSSSSLVELFNSFDNKNNSPKRIYNNEYKYDINIIEQKDEIKYLCKKRKI